MAVVGQLFRALHGSFLQEFASFKEDHLAEVVILNTAVMTALKGVADREPDPRAYMAKVLEDGMAEMRKTNYPTVSPEGREAFLSNVEARWGELVTGVLK